MLELLKKHSLVGLSLAIAAGFVLAHIANRTVDHLYEGYPDQLVLAVSCFVAVLILVGVLRARRSEAARALFTRYKRHLVIAAVMLIAAYLSGVAYTTHTQEALAQQQQTVQSNWMAEQKHEDDHHFDDLIREHKWVFEHPKDARLRFAPKGKELEKRLHEQHVDPTRLSDTNNSYADILDQGTNEQIVQSIKNITGTDAEAKSEAEKLGYIYAFDQEASKANVRRANNFVSIFFPYDEVLRKYRN
jgi:hypothetical protein